MGCDNLQADFGFYEYVSIHAPVWGATVRTNAVAPAAKVSIHAPVWGATLQEATGGLISRPFQSTHPCGVRQLSVIGVQPTNYVSIHAPVWGATSNMFNVALTLDVSIHAPVWGATMCRSWS